MRPGPNRVALEGAIDFFLGRPRQANPYDEAGAPGSRAAWLDGWREALLQDVFRGDRERARWRCMAFRTLEDRELALLDELDRAGR